MIVPIDDAPYIRAAQETGNNTMWRTWGESGENDNGTEADD
ncbi:MAG: hypothetical protein VB082_08130 [Christensenella sp.]|nr:hypothetical protein [Christensenella sp.]